LLLIGTCLQHGPFSSVLCPAWDSSASSQLVHRRPRYRIIRPWTPPLAMQTLLKRQVTLHHGPKAAPRTGRGTMPLDRIRVGRGSPPAPIALAALPYGERAPRSMRVLAMGSSIRSMTAGLGPPGRLPANPSQ